MKLLNKKTQLSIICIIFGTISGLLVYGIFLYFKIAIFGWNLGLIFAPLVAGYVETILANKMLGENLGAISAFILFIDTTIYSFILKNPTLGVNLITAGSIIVILQAAFPTLINHILLVVIGGFLSKLLKKFKKISEKIKNTINNRPTKYLDNNNIELKTTVLPYFDEEKSNQNLNKLNFFFITSSDIIDKKHKLLNFYQSTVILEKDKHLIHSEPEKTEMKHLIKIKEGKDECLIKLANQIKGNGGNGILDLSMNYAIIGLNGDNIQITAMGIGIYIE